MTHAQDRLKHAQRIHAAGLNNVATTPEPEGQKFHKDERVVVFGHPHVRDGTQATVMYTYAHAFPDFDAAAVKTYSLDVDHYGHMSWFAEDQLAYVGGWPSKRTITYGEIEALLNKYDEEQGHYPENEYEGKSVLEFFKRELGYGDTE